MKVEQKLKIILIILLIILISLISFGGIYIQRTKFVENKIPNYQLGMDLTGGRVILLEVSTDTNTIFRDKDGNIVNEEGDDTTKEEVAVNAPELLTEENYRKSEEIIKERLSKMGVTDYTLRFDEKTGKMILQIPEGSNTDEILQYIMIKGEFKIVDSENEENVLLKHEHIKNAQWGYSTTATGTNIYLTISFNEEGTEILKNITNTYVATTDEEGKEQSKDVSFKIDDTTLITSHFSEEISNGILQLSIGQATTSSEDLTEYIQEASRLAVILSSKALPVTYNMNENRYVVSDITEDMLFIPMIICLSLVAIGVIFLVLRYRKNGLLSAISFIGYIAFYLIALRYTNVIITLEGIIGILIAIILNYIFIVYLLHLLKNEKMKTIEETSNGFKKALLKTLFILVPVAIISVTLCFTKWLPASSFGMVIFWGIFISILYNLIITRTLIVASTKNK